MSAWDRCRLRVEVTALLAIRAADVKRAVSDKFNYALFGTTGI
jgi:hypothetical protein